MKVVDCMEAGMFAIRVEREYVVRVGILRFSDSQILRFSRLNGKFDLKSHRY